METDNANKGESAPVGGGASAPLPGKGKNTVIGVLAYLGP